MTVLLDTSMWIKHFRVSNMNVVKLLETEQAACHEFVVTELACGSLKSREKTIGYLKELITVPSVSVEEMQVLIEAHSLYSRGIGFVDVQLLASVLITPDTQLWTADDRLRKIASELGVSYATV